MKSVKLSKSGNEITEILTVVYGDKALKKHIFSSGLSVLKKSDKVP